MNLFMLQARTKMWLEQVKERHQDAEFGFAVDLLSGDMVHAARTPQGGCIGFLRIHKNFESGLKDGEILAEEVYHPPKTLDNLPLDQKAAFLCIRFGGVVADVRSSP